MESFFFFFCSLAANEAESSDTFVIRRTRGVHDGRCDPKVCGLSRIDMILKRFAVS